VLKRRNIEESDLQLWMPVNWLEQNKRYVYCALL